MGKTVAQKRAAFAALHEKGCFVIPNPWDLGSARMLESLGFAALATTSSGFAWTTGRPDYGVKRDDVVEHLHAMCAAVELPINADFESGFEPTPEGVAASVKLALDAGVAGLSIEDTVVDGKGLYSTEQAVERVRAAKAAIGSSGALLVARTEILLHDKTQVNVAIDKLVAFAEAGADCLYAPGVSEPQDIAEMVRAVAPKPVNFLVTANLALSLAELAGLGVRRVSVGGALARVAWKAAIDGANALKEGHFGVLKDGVPHAAINSLFSSSVRPA